MRSARIVVAMLVTALGVPALAGCGPGEPSTMNPQAETTTPAPSRREPTTPKPPDENLMRMEIAIGDQRFQATMADSAASRDLLAQLPQTLEMTDHGGVEKTGPLRGPLSTQGQPSGADPEVGDVGYYAPGNDLVLYYGDQSYFPGIVILGKLEGDAARKIAGLARSVTVTVEAR